MATNTNYPEEDAKQVTDVKRGGGADDRGGGPDDSRISKKGHPGDDVEDESAPVIRTPVQNDCTLSFWEDEPYRGTQPDCRKSLRPALKDPVVDRP